MQISKSEYMMSLKHPAWIWLKKHRASVLPKPSPSLQARFDEGNAFERHALELFPGVLELGFDDLSGYRSLTGRTQEALNQDVPAIAQGRFEAGPITCIVDVLRSGGEERFDLVEIKSSTSVKEEHIFDLAFQRAVLEDAGIPLRDIFVCHVNKDYRRCGDIDPQGLVSQVKVTEDVEQKMDFTRRAITRALQIVGMGEMPDPSPRYARMKSYSDWLEIYQCVVGPLPGDSIFTLPYIKAQAVNDLLDRGVSTIDQIGDLSMLTPGQVRYVEGRSSRARQVDREGVSSFLGALTYPLYFLDYETSSGLVPPFDGLGPYQQLPFQYSLHIQREPNGEIEQREYLHEQATNPVPALLDQLSSDIGPEGSVLVWYAPFETSRNREMGSLVEEYAPFLEDLNMRVVDLMDPFKQEMIVYPEFEGSTSIKKVLPVMVPELAYQELEIQEGETASRIWKEATLDGRHTEQRQKIYQNLREYCRLDTWAMVRIFQVMSEI